VGLRIIRASCCTIY